MIKRKGQDTLVKAWPEVLRSHPDARLLLVGDGPNRKAVERLARRREVTDSVIFTGSVPWDEVPAYTDAGDVFAMPCRTRLFGLEPEAFGIVFLEAWACALQVVAGRSGGAAEAAQGPQCCVVDGRHPATVAAALEQKLEHGDRAPRPLVEDVRTWRTIRAQFANLIELID
jgi:phosphatidylinositol alpha-1,6-mannosyltransferase